MYHVSILASIIYQAISCQNLGVIFAISSLFIYTGHKLLPILSSNISFLSILFLSLLPCVQIFISFV